MKANKSKTRKPAVVVTGSVEYARQVAELRRSNAAGLHTPKPRKGTRGARNRKAIREWL